MKIGFITDSHNEFYSGKLPDNLPEEQDIELLLCTGDLDNISTRAALYLLDRYPNIPILYIPGNHEYYGKWTFDEKEDLFRELDSKYDNFYFFGLESPGRFIHNEFVFICGTNWANVPKDSIANQIIYDVKAIPNFDYGKVSKDNETIVSIVEETFNIFKPRENYKFVLATHFAPHYDLCNNKWKREAKTDTLTREYFSSNIPMELLRELDYCFFGHTHDNLNKTIGKCRFRNGGRGYPLENTGFDGQYIFEL